MSGLCFFLSRPLTTYKLTKTAVLFSSLIAFGIVAEATWGSATNDLAALTVEPEYRCSAYNRKRDYSYSSRIETRIAERAGYAVNSTGWLDRPFPSRYMAHVFVRSLRDTDIEHIVAASEAHDSGLCAASRAARRSFASDLDNLTLALPSTNRYAKQDKDAADWLPEINVCWYVSTVVAVKRKYNLSVDQAEYDALDKAIADHCTGDSF